jgi:leucyl aminopeptidase (aminopeptidase T)
MVMTIPLLGSRAMINDAIMPVARSILRTNVELKNEEAVFVVADSTRVQIADALAFAALELTKEVSMSIMTPRRVSDKEPPKTIGVAMRSADVVLVCTEESITFTEAVRRARKNARIISMPGVTEKMIVNGGLSADFTFVKEQTSILERALHSASIYRISSANGTEVTFRRGKRNILCDDGDFSKKGKLGNLPAGEACFAIIENSTNGKIVVDRMGNIVTEPLKLTIEKGKIVNAEGRDSGRFMETINLAKKSGDINADNIAEFGVGTNPMARHVESELEAEKIYGTVHFGVGSNSTLPGGKSKSNIHHDGVILDPVLEIRNTVILRERKFYIKANG